MVISLGNSYVDCLPKALHSPTTLNLSPFPAIIWRFFATTLRINHKRLKKNSS